MAVYELQHSHINHSYTILNDLDDVQSSSPAGLDFLDAGIVVVVLALWLLAILIFMRKWNKIWMVEVIAFANFSQPKHLEYIQIVPNLEDCVIHKTIPLLKWPAKEETPSKLSKKSSKKNKQKPLTNETLL